MCLCACMCYYIFWPERQDILVRLVPMHGSVMDLVFIHHVHLPKSSSVVTFFFNFINLFIIYGCIGSSLLHAGFLQLWRAGATLRCSARASYCGGFSCCGARALGARAQQLWRTGLVAPRHVGSSRTRARTRVPCIGFLTTVPPGKSRLQQSLWNNRIRS